MELVSRGKLKKYPNKMESKKPWQITFSLFIVIRRIALNSLWNSFVCKFERENARYPIVYSSFSDNREYLLKNIKVYPTLRNILFCVSLRVQADLPLAKKFTWNLNNFPSHSTFSIYVPFLKYSTNIINYKKKHMVAIFWSPCLFQLQNTLHI